MVDWFNSIGNIRLRVGVPDDLEWRNFKYPPEFEFTNTMLFRKSPNEVHEIAQEADMLLK